MALNKYKLGELIKQSFEKNKENIYGLSSLKGISIQKIFIQTKADMEGVSLKPYLLVEPNYFAYVTVTSRNGEKITLAHNTTDNTYIVSSSYNVFFVDREDLLLPDYLFMYFNRAEFDRYTRFNSWGSARETFSWEDMCDIDIELPSIEVQQKYVDVYNSMVATQKNFERGLLDLKLTCDGFIDHIKSCTNKVAVSKFLKEVDNRNTNLETTEVKGVNINKEFMPSVANTTSTDLRKYKVISKGVFVYSAMQTGRDEVIRIALYNDEIKALVSPAYAMLAMKDKSVLPEYIMIWFSRSESDRFGWFLSDASIRASLELNRFLEIEIPIPEISMQQAIVDIYNVYNMRKDLNEKMKQQIKDICPILIKGSLETN